MAPIFPEPRKQRTRQHVIADQSVNHVERFVIDAGHTVQRVAQDYGYDLSVTTFDEHGYAEPGLFYLQLKAAEQLEESGTDYVFDLDVRDYRQWMLELFPVILVQFDATRRRAFWLFPKGYFRQHPSRRPKNPAQTVRVRVPSRQRVSRRAVAKWRSLKQQVSERAKGVVDDG